MLMAHMNYFCEVIETSLVTNGIATKFSNTSQMNTCHQMALNDLKDVNRLQNAVIMFNFINVQISSYNNCLIVNKIKKKKKKKIEWKIKLKMLKKIKIMLAIIHSTIHDFFMVLLVTSISWSSTDNMLEKHTWSLSIDQNIIPPEPLDLDILLAIVFFPRSIALNSGSNRLFRCLSRSRSRRRFLDCSRCSSVNGLLGIFYTNSRTNLLRHKRYNNGRNAECQSDYEERRKDNERSLNDDVDDSDNYYKIIVCTPPRHRYLFTAGCNLFELTIYIFTLH
ncbi:hypothetical protein AGLY_013104 [Aphis glycines]|uniref:Uncharacterized protein n=1 Tax=Aphis glycines TaxID=307491 RepID=A0A6G0T8N1_APHGL|nr:hypothetical protein AGLY_013104 [Aphis glycines]